MPSITISAYDPSGKQRSRRINSNHYTPNEVEEITKSFKQWVHDGKPHNEFKIKESVSGVVNAILPVPQKEHFERRKISSLELPENKAMSFACIGSTRSGKSYALCHLWETIFKKHITFLMTLSSHADIYKPLKSKAVITDGFHPDLIEEPMNINKHTKNHYDFCLIFDDLALEGKTSEQMTKLLTIGRNSGMSAIISGQKMTMLSSTGRSNINFVLCFKQNTETAIEDTIKTYLRSYFPKGMKMPEMIAMYKDLTADHNFFCVNTLTDECFISKI
jgi:hypothetical protein